MKYCTSCVLSEKFPGISFDSDGVCNYCTGGLVADDDKKTEYLREFEKLLAEKKGKSSYDLIMAYSGGKDSTYTMMLLAQKYGLRILAWTLDNGFLSPQAMINITRMTDAAGATGMIVRPPFGIMKSAFKKAASEDFYSPKTLDRASSICTTCIGVVKSMVLKTAIEMNIPLAAYGWSPGQAPISSAILQTSARMQVFTNRSVRDPLVSREPDIAQFFLSDEDLKSDKERWPINIHPLAFFDYNEEYIIEEIGRLGWQKPDDTDSNSTNCLLNALANHIHKKKFGFHPYAWEIAGIVRSGSMPREEGIEKITQEENPAMVKLAAERLGLTL